MLNITAAQYNSLGHQSEKHFEERLGQWLIEKFDGQFDKSEAQTMASQAIAKSRKYEIKTEKDIAYIAERMVMEGVEFERLAHNGYVKEILDSETIAGEEKIYDIYKHELEMSLSNN